MVKVDSKTKLKKLNLRATPVRIAVMDFLEKTKKPVDVKIIISQLKKINIKVNPSTVFRMLNIFTKKGITAEVQLEKGKIHYELTTKGDHHHLVCEKCKKIEDITECIVPRLEKRIKEKSNFFVKSHFLEFFGLCRNCH